MMKTLSKNFLYNVLYQMLSYVIPFIVMPYISRVLGAESLGVYSYTYSIVSYFMMGAVLGINNYGVRLIARNSHDKIRRSQCFYSLYSLQFCLSMIMIVLYFLLISLFIHDYRLIYYLQGLHLLSVMIDINWFFWGMEEFKVTITRNTAIKLTTLGLTFLFVNKASDLWKYVCITGTGAFFSQLYLWYCIRKKIVKVKVSGKEIFAHFPGCVKLFIPIIAYSIYRIMDKTMLGGIVGLRELGYYEGAEKILNIPIGIITAMGTVMLPYMSKRKKAEESSRQLLESFELCMFLVIPMWIGLFFAGSDLAIVFLGKEFEVSGTILRFLCITILFGGIANVVRTNYLIPGGHDAIYIQSTIYGAGVNFVLNLALIKKMGIYGVCIGTIAAEFLVMFYQVKKTKANIEYKFVIQFAIKYLKSTLPFVYVFFINLQIDQVLLRLILQITSMILIYFVANRDYVKKFWH